jgi:hypothetical protein
MKTTILYFSVLLTFGMSIGTMLGITQKIISFPNPGTEIVFACVMLILSVAIAVIGLDDNGEEIQFGNNVKRN